MTDNRKLIGALAIARKAGKLKHGADAAIEALEKGAPLAVVTSDCSERTLRHTKAACKGELLQLPLTDLRLPLLLLALRLSRLSRPIPTT